MRFLYIFIFVLLILNSCENNNKEVKRDWKKIDKQLIDINKYLLKADKERIESYIERNEWHMQQTGTGLWYEIYEKGAGEIVKEGYIATISYSVELLDGTKCYSSDSLGNKTFKVGYGNLESGIQEGIMLMHEGDKARFILPPYLGWGLAGDDDKIPPRAILVYDVELISLD
jgi:FKBP-type peptidyl-prolyl cis-trans isomerase